jgi:hypothetical protein
MLKPTLENFDTLWIKTSQEGKRTACIVKIEGIGSYAKHWKKQIKLTDALKMIESMTLESIESAVNKIEVYVK